MRIELPAQEQSQNQSTSRTRLIEVPTKMFLTPSSLMSHPMHFPYKLLTSLLDDPITPINLIMLIPFLPRPLLVVNVPFAIRKYLTCRGVRTLENIVRGVILDIFPNSRSGFGAGFRVVAPREEDVVVRFVGEGVELDLHQPGEIGLAGMFDDKRHF